MRPVLSEGSVHVQILPLAALISVWPSRAEDAVAALSQTEIESGRTTDPVRMYMREMGTVDLLTREGEIEIAKRIEEGMRDLLAASVAYPRTVEYVIDYHQMVKDGEKKINDFLNFSSDVA